MRIAALALLGVVVFAGCATPGSGPSTLATSPTSDKGPAWEFTAIDGATFTRDAPERNATLLFFMATWCGSCIQKAPLVAEVASEYAARGVATYSLDFDPTESRADIEAWQRDRAQPWPHGIDEELRIQRTFKVTSQSSVLVLDQAGNVVKHFGYGQANAAQLREALDAALARGAAAT